MSSMFMQVIPTWLVVVNGQQYRVPKDKLDAFLDVLTFNNLEFQVSNVSYKDFPKQTAS